MKNILKITILLFIALLSTSHCQTTPNLVIQWNNIFLNEVKIAGTPSTIVSRSLMLLHTSIYDAWACYDAVALGTRFAQLLRRPLGERTDANIQQAICFAAYRVMADIYPNNLNSSTTLMQNLGYDINNLSEDITTPAGIGNKVSRILLNFRHGDGSNQYGDLNPGNYSDYSLYTPVNTVANLVDLNHWQPLSNANGGQTFVTPYWGLIKTFTGVKVNFTAPPVYPSDAFTAQVQELVNISAALNDTTKMIAEYWADGTNTVTPPGHWCQFAQNVSNRDNHTMGDDVKMFFILTTALFDSSIVCLENQRKYDSVRPITAIRYIYNNTNITAWGGPSLGNITILGNIWLPYLSTPASPEYFAAHSTFSAASAEVLKRFTGSDNFGFNFTFAVGSSTIEPLVTPSTQITLNYSTFSDALNDAGMSRRYAGIHFSKSDLDGRAAGRLIGQIAYFKSMELITGIINTNTTFSTNTSAQINSTNPDGSFINPSTSPTDSPQLMSSSMMININLFVCASLILLFF